MGWHNTDYDPRVDGMADDYGDDRPSASDLAEEAWENSRKRNYPRGYGPPLEGEDDPAYMDPNGASLEGIDPDRYLQEEDIPHAPQAESFGAPIYHLRTPGADYPDETDPAEWEDREEEYAHENLRGHFGATERYDPKTPSDFPSHSAWLDYLYGPLQPGEVGVEVDRHLPDQKEGKRTPAGGILTQADQWPDRVAANRTAAEPDCESEGFDHYYRGGVCEDCGKEEPDWDGATDAHPIKKHHGAKERDPGNGLDMVNYEFFHNHDPQLGTTVPEHKYGEPEGAVGIRPPEEAQPGDAVVLHPDVTGLEYPAVCRWNDEHGSWDVLKPLR